MRLPRRHRWRLALALLVALLALGLAVAPFRRLSPHSTAPQPAAPQAGVSQASGSQATGSQATNASYPVDAIPLQVGIQVKNLYNVQIDSQTFSADGWYTLAWDQRLEDLIREANIPLDRLVEFDNQVEMWDAVIEAETPEPLVAPDGSRSLMVRFSARFYIAALDLHNSPFDTIVLPIVLETRPDLFSLAQEAVRLEPAEQQENLVGDYGDVAGYELRGATLRPAINSYELLGAQKLTAHSQLVLRVSYGTDVLAAFLKWVLPMLIVMIVVLLAPSLEGSLGDIRLAIPSTALLTLVFLQQTYRAELPATPYPTFLDQMYAYCYFVAVGLFLLFVWSSNLYEEAPEGQREVVRRRINRVDALCQMGALVGGVVWALMAWFL